MPEPNTPSATFGLLIPNWNGEAFIERCLGSVLAAIRHCGRPVEILVIDDAGGDRSPDIIEHQFPGVRLVRHERNVGFAETVNEGMGLLAADWVFLLNNDLALPVDFCARLIAALENAEDPANLFAIGAQTRDWDAQEVNHGGQRAVWMDGLIGQEPEMEPEGPPHARPTVFFQAGACLINRGKFLSLEGFAPFYRPGYWEDYDLGYRACRIGWTNLYEPRAMAYHLGKSSMTRLLGQRGVSRVTRRNHLLFNWANLDDYGLLIDHLLGLPFLILRDRPGEEESGWGLALLGALGRLPEALRHRRRRRQSAREGRAAGDRKLLGLGKQIS